MAVARPRHARRRGLSWQRAAALAALAAVGAAALWSSLNFSEAHALARAGDQASRHAGQQQQRQQQQQQQQQQASEARQDGKDTETKASLDAWTQLTSVGAGGGSSGSAASGAGSEAGSGSDSSSGGTASTGSTGAGGAAGGAATTGKQDAAQPAVLGAAGSPSGLLTVELKVPKAPPTLNDWVLNEDLLLFHRAALQSQLEQAYVGLALAAAAGRAFALPPFACFCHQAAGGAGGAPPRCRRPGADAVRFPEPCPTADVLAPLPEFAADPATRGTPLAVVERAAVEAIPASEVLVLRPSATILWPRCAGEDKDKAPCVQEGTADGGATLLLVPPSLNDTHLLPLLQPYQKFKLWRLDFSHVGSHWHAFAGWDCAEPARKFDQRMAGLPKAWPAPSGDAMQPLPWTTGRTYSAEPDMKQGCPAGGGLGTAGGAAATARRLARQLAQRWREEDLRDLR